MDMFRGSQAIRIIKIGILLFFTTQVYALGHDKKRTPNFTHQTSNKKAGLVSFFSPYLEVSGGYGNYRSMQINTGATPFMRLALGSSLFPFSDLLLLGGELGVQSGKTMQLSNEILAPMFVNVDNSIPAFITLSTSVDLLATFTLLFKAPIFLKTKIGAVYLQNMPSMNTLYAVQTHLEPELQVGLGWRISEKSQLILGYQRFFGQKLFLSNINLIEGTAQLNHLPTWQSGMLALEITI